MLVLGQVLEKNKGIGPGFDFLRIGLAASIVGMHSFFLSGNGWIRHTPFWYLEYCQVPMFFALSGFLVTGSAMRLSLGNFLINRGLRIIPALAVDVVICACIIGPVVTTYPAHKYVFDHRFFLYFLNITGWIHFFLPGVFETHPDPQVNGALWTVPYEMFCYAVMSFFIVTKWVKSPLFVAAVTVAFLFSGLIIEHLYARSAHPGFLFRAIHYWFVLRGAQLVASFLMGILVYQMRHHIPYSWPLFWFCIAICVVAVFTMHTSDADQVGNRFLFVPPLIYITVFLGLTKIWIPRFLHRGDYSYGIYLYHDPFLQIIIALVPATVAIKLGGGIILYALGLPVAFAVAWFSWHFIEKPILALRKKFSFVAKIRGVAGEASTVNVPTPDEARAEFGKA